MSFSFSGGADSVTIIEGNSVTFSWNLTGGYNSASITNHGTLTSTGSATTYNVRNIPRWFSTSPPPGDHMCALSNPGGYTYEGILCKFFTTAPPGSFGGYDAEAPGVKPVSGLMGYVWPASYSAPVATTIVYEYSDPNGGTPNGFGTIWTTNSSGEGPYTTFIQSFKTPNAAYTDYSGIVFSGSATKSPSVSTIYTLTASGPGLTNFSKSITVTVYQKVAATLTASPDAIVAGNSSELSWTVTGTASSASIDQGIGSVLFNSSQNVSPSSTTTYTLSASGLGGSDSDSVTVTVYQRPELTVTFPGTYDYGIDQDMEVTTRYASSVVKVDFTFLYFGGTTDTATINLTPNSSSETGDATTQTFIPEIPWNDFGPETIDILVTATGEGGTVTRLQTETVIIDRLPDNINIPDRLELAPSTDPVVSPDEDTILSDPLLIDDIDIPVEIKASQPIQVKFDDDDPGIESNWKSLRSLY